MDAYAAIVDTSAPCFVSEISEDWFPSTVTHSVAVVRAIAEKKQFPTASSVRGKASESFTLIDLPVLAGLDRIRAFYKFQDNWDAEQGAAPVAETLDAASKVFSLISVHKVPEITLSSDGYPMLMFDSHVRGEVVITAPNKIDYFFAGDDAPFGDDVEFDGRLPDQLIEYIRA